MNNRKSPEWIEFNQKMKKRAEQKERLNNAFKEKGIDSIHDKRRIMVEVLGHKPSLGEVKEEELDMLIGYLEAKEVEDLRSPIIGWVAINDKDTGIRKHHMKELLVEIPANVDGFLLTYPLTETGSNGKMLHGYFNYTFYQENEQALMQTFQTMKQVKAEEIAPGIYTVDEQLTFTFLKQ